MTERGIKKWLIERVRKIYKETNDSVIVGNEVSEEYWTELKLRQGCPMSSLLFAVFIADMEEVLTFRWSLYERIPAFFFLM